MHTKTPLEPAEILESMPRNKDLQTLINAFRPHRGESIYPDTYGNTVVWSELQQAILILIQQNNLLHTFCLITLKLCAHFTSITLLTMHDKNGSFPRMTHNCCIRIFYHIRNTLVAKLRQIVMR